MPSKKSERLREAAFKVLFKGDFDAQREQELARCMNINLKGNLNQPHCCGFYGHYWDEKSKAFHTVVSHYAKNYQLTEAELEDAVKTWRVVVAMSLNGQKGEKKQ